METGSCARHPPGPKRGASRAPPAPHCLIRIHLARRQRGAPHPGMLPPSAAAHGAAAAAICLENNRPKPFGITSWIRRRGEERGDAQTPTPRRVVGAVGCAGAEGVGAVVPRPRPRAASPSPLRGGVCPRPGGSAGRRFPAAGARCGAAWWFARISPS